MPSQPYARKPEYHPVGWANIWPRHEPPVEPECEPGEVQRNGLTVKELIYWQETLSRLDISLHDSARLRGTIQDRAYVVYTAKEAIGVHQPSGAKLFETCPMPELRREHIKPPNNICVPRRHETVTYNNVTFILPESAVGRRFYVVTRGILLGVFHNWVTAAPFVDGVKGAVYQRVPTLEDGGQIMLDAVDDGLAKYLKFPVPAGHATNPL